MSSVEVIQLTWNWRGFEVPDAVSYTWSMQLDFPNGLEQEYAKHLNYSTHRMLFSGLPKPLSEHVNVYHHLL